MKLAWSTSEFQDMFQRYTEEKPCPGGEKEKRNLLKSSNKTVKLIMAWEIHYRGTYLQQQKHTYSPELNSWTLLGLLDTGQTSVYSLALFLSLLTVY